MSQENWHIREVGEFNFGEDSNEINMRGRWSILFLSPPTNPIIQIRVRKPIDMMCIPLPRHTLTLSLVTAICEQHGVAKISGISYMLKFARKVSCITGRSGWSPDSSFTLVALIVPELQPTPHVTRRLTNPRR